jgi:hypothetical protein
MIQAQASPFNLSLITILPIMRWSLIPSTFIAVMSALSFIWLALAISHGQPLEKLETSARSTKSRQPAH